MISVPKICYGSNLTTDTSLKEITAEIVKNLRELKDTIREEVDAELKYAKKTRSLKKLTGSDYRNNLLGTRNIQSLGILLQELKQKTSLQISAHRKLVNELHYEIDDCIDVITSEGNASRWKSLFSRVSLLGGANLKNLKDKTQSILDLLPNEANIMSSDRPQPQLARAIPTSTVVEEDRYFGPDKNKITELLLKSNTDLKDPVISIFGPRGLGKTSLSKILYNDLKIRRHFQSFAWVYLPEDFQARNIMQSILVQLLPSMKKTIMEMPYLKLMEEFNNVQQNNKCLIVLSDLQNRENWTTLNLVSPPSDKNQSRILVTTHEQNLAKEIGISHKITTLDEDQSWELFTTRTGISFNQQTEKAWKEIVRPCKGSRLAIAILAGYLNTIDRSLSDWDTQLVVELQSHLSDQEADLEIITVETFLSLSYSKLSQELQKCFLYLGHFPLEREIQVEELYAMWIDEGLISSQSSMVAEQYLEELVQRNLVQMLQEEGSFTSCKLHPLVQHFCIVKAKEEALYQVIPSNHQDCNIENQTRSLVRRISIKPTKYKAGNFSRFSERAKADRSRLRSLFVFHTSEPEPDLKQLELLRVLELYGVDFREWNLEKWIGELIYLRYLSFKRCYLEKLPPSVGDLSHIKTLDLQVQSHCRMSIPDVLWKMTQLKRLYFPRRYRSADKSGKLSLRELKELEILVNFNTDVCNVGDLTAMTKLQNIGAIVEEDAMLFMERILSDLAAEMVFNDLRHSSLDVRNFNCYSEGKRTALVKLLGCEHLNSLRFDGFVNKFPDNTIFSPKLTEIELSGAELEADPMQSLGKIPNLRSLALCNNAYIGKKMHCTGFLQLRSLKLMNLRSLETWEVEIEAMPELLSLCIEKCVKLAMLPAGLTSMKSLRELKIVSMPTAFEARLQEVEGKKGEDLNKVDHVPRILISS